MRTIDSDLKKIQDELTEAKNNLNALSKSKDAKSLASKDPAEVIYTC